MTPDAISPRPDPGGRRWSWSHVVGALVPMAGLGVLAVFDVPFCPTKHLFGVPCPGCGLTRATVALASLDLTTSLAMHPLALVVTPLMAWVLLRILLVGVGVLAADSPDPLTRVPSWAWATLLAVLLGVWIARLFGGLGGHPDPIDPARGLLTRAFFLFGG